MNDEWMGVGSKLPTEDFIGRLNSGLSTFHLNYIQSQFRLVRSSHLNLAFKFLVKSCKVKVYISKCR